MTNHVMITHVAPSALTGSAIVRHALGWLTRVAAALSNRMAVHKLRDFDERMLKDIGLVGSDVSAALDCGMTEDPSVHLREVAAGRGRLRR